jgi:hypothetical protein
MSLVANAAQLVGLNGLQMLDPLILKFCNNSQKKGLLLKGGISIGLTAAGIGLGYVCEPLAILCSTTSSVVLGNIVSEGLNIGLYHFKEGLDAILEKYDLDRYTGDILDPVIDIAAAVGVRQLAGLSTNIPGLNQIFNGLPQYSNHTLDVAAITNISVYSPPEKGAMGSFFSKLGSGLQYIFNLGSSTDNVKGNPLSQSLDLAGQNMMLHGLFKIGETAFKAIHGWFTGKKTTISKYDIKSILKAQLKAENIEFESKMLKAQAEQIYARIEQSEKYYESFSKRPDMKKSIDTVSNLYREKFGEALKEQYGSALSNNPKLLAKSHELVDKLIKAEVTGRLIGAKEAYSKIIQFKQCGISMPEEMRGFIKDAAQQKLAQEANSLNATEKEKQVYKYLFSKTAEIEIEFAQLSYLFMAMQQEAEFSPELANA